MACIPTNIIREVDHSCGYSKGGVTRIWISLLEGNGVDVFGWLDGYTGYSFVDNKATGERHLDMDALDLTSDAASALGSDASTFVEIKFNDRDGETKFNEVLERGEDGYGFYEISIDVEIPNMDYISNPAVAQITDGAVDFVAIVETNALGDRFRSTYHFLGRENGLRFLRVEGDSGSSKSDRNLYKMQLRGYEKDMSFLIKTNPLFSFNGLPASVALIDPSSPISTNNLVEADFVGAPTTAYVNDKISFTDTSISSPNSWNWNFGDASTSSDQNPVHQYATAGSYDVSLSAENNYTIDVESKPSYITISDKAFVNIGTYQETASATLAYITASPVSRIELNLDGFGIIGNTFSAQNILNEPITAGGTGDLLMWSDNPANINQFYSNGDRMIVDLDSLTSNFTGLGAVSAHTATGTISFLNNMSNVLSVSNSLTGNLDFDSFDTAASINSLSLVGGSFTANTDSWIGDIPTLTSFKLYPSGAVSSTDVDFLIIKLSGAFWAAGISELVIMGNSGAPTPASAAAISTLNGMGVTVTTN